mmetsp:Transcript_7918/g.20354  ORF Transcript_7918/g.20354 Transcript_7918/m.20354 type:complete len:87 (+) Transcript_7918:1275-1535(+)
MMIGKVTDLLLVCVCFLLFFFLCWLQGNVDPVTLFSTKAGIEAAIDDCIAKAGTTGHVLNLGHGVMVGTPEESVAHFFEYNRSKLY